MKKRDDERIITEVNHLTLPTGGRKAPTNAVRRRREEEWTRLSGRHSRKRLRFAWWYAMAKCARSDPDAKASRVQKRRLDSMAWAVTAYDRHTGKCTLTRGALSRTDSSISSHSGKSAIVTRTTPRFRRCVRANPGSSETSLWRGPRADAITVDNPDLLRRTEELR